MNPEDLTKNRFFYALPDHGESVSESSVRQLPQLSLSGWNMREGEIWTSWIPESKHLPRSGWKIHVSVSLQNFDKAVRQIATILFEKRVHFKHARNSGVYRSLLEKNADRRQCGKAFTVYPSRFEVADIARALSEIDFEPGPEVVTDMPTVFDGISIRFGGFVASFTPDGKAAYETDDGELVEDSRQPVDPSVEDVTKWPDDIRSVLDKDHGNLIAIEPTRALKQSAAGGVYEAVFEGRYSVVKQGRAGVGFDDSGLDGYERILHEGNVLQTIRLSGERSVPEVLAILEEQTDCYLILEKLEGISLHRWKGENYPLYGNREKISSYLSEVLRVVNKLVIIVDRLHKLGYSHNDLHSRNIIINHDSGELKLIDFESAYKDAELSNSSKLPKAPGYMGWNVPNGKEADWYAVSQVLQDLLFANIVHLDMDKHGVHRGWAIGFRELKEADGEAWKELGSLFESIRNRANIGFKAVEVAKYEFRELQSFFPSTPDLIYAISDEGLEDSILPGPAREGLSGLFYGGFHPWKELLNSYRNNGTLRDERPVTLTGLASGESRNSEEEFLSRKSVRDGGLLGSSRLESLVYRLLVAPSTAQAFECENLYAETLEFMGDVDRNLKSNADSSFESNLVQNSREFQTGLVYGFLAYAFPISRFLASGRVSTRDEKFVVHLLKRLLQAELKSYVEDGHGGLQARVGNRLLPYLATGSAGFGPVLRGLSSYRCELQIDEEAAQLLVATRPLTCNSIGLFNGYTGLLVGADGISNYLGMEFNRAEWFEHAISMSLDNGNGQNVLKGGIPSDGGFRMSTDFATGSLGVDYAWWLMCSDSKSESFVDFAEWVL